MSIRENYYLIQPNVSLLATITAYQAANNTTIIADLDETFIWHYTSGNRSPIFPISALKLLFLAHLHSSYVVSQDIPILIPLVEQLIQPYPFNPATFDKW